MTKLNITVLLTSLMLISCSTSSIESKILDSSSKDTTTTVPSTPQSAVDRHNEIRAEVFSGSTVVWNETLASTAQEYANYLASNGKFEHDYGSGYGENLYASSNESTYVDAINSWYGEKSNYNYSNNSCATNTMCGHYTQIIWKNSTEIGCGQATYTTGNYKGGTVTVCRYNHAGNYVGEKPY